MRGARNARHGRHRQAGIIPAYAGSTESNPTGDNSHGDHPRVCGEHRLRTCGQRCQLGSSPRMRGARRSHGIWCSTPGIIPAYAGSTRCPCSRYPTSRDHPRVCGEHPAVLARRSGFPGSSPRMRGALKLRGTGASHGGIIPAYAGSTQRRFPEDTRWWDHPRVCGEHALDDLSAKLDKGSSPRMRGARFNCW